MTDKPADEPRAAMAIVARFDGFVNYLYPMLTNTSRQHRVLRDTLIEAMFAQYRLFHNAGKSNQASRLYEADAGLAYLRELLRFMVGPDRKLVENWGQTPISPGQSPALRVCRCAAQRIWTLTPNFHAMLGAWVKSAQKRSGGG